ncbi:hypothetical protein FS800_23410 [Agrobacterium vitis]|uniref:DUF7210 family protein n=1 Tax=Rhizobium/Agrobacterium group TaxID=227290 RepID=UPI0012E98E53|nr:MULTISPECIES: hypothetical protein [Rhizobium/Agrobacterium group]MCF1446630.1 hypothetical protein [Allorhizobium ampelinum]MCF1485081.1 hypothetical protein [Allorhizobium ampelinum]MCF1492495.1 hypothetical protein [Allorhizobium ampelinum]MVA44486.1 hypothetical protein [Agrobacterium vitis]NSZ53477.1 hypothetical protein [Agrobacterium vitis]
MAVKNSEQAEPKIEVVLIKPARIDGVKIMPGKTVSVDATVLEQLVSNGAVVKSADDADAKPAENAA